MRSPDAELLERYLRRGDAVLAELDAAARPEDEAFASQRWLRESPAKRLVFEEIYGDLLRDGPRGRVLDVGGGFTSLTRELLRRHDYRLLDLMAHDDDEALARVEATLGRFWDAVDWFDLEEPGEWDVVVANDLFPNVDQRLLLFLERFLPRSREVRLSLTCYDGRRFYKTRRVDGDEILILVAWDPEQTRRALAPFAERIEGDLSALDRPAPSLFPNGRLVWTVRLRGDLG